MTVIIESQRIMLAAHENTIRILTNDLARGNIARAELEAELIELKKPKPETTAS